MTDPLTALTVTEARDGLAAGLAGVAALAGAAYWWRHGRLGGARSPGSVGDEEARAAGHRSLASGSNRKMR